MMTIGRLTASVLGLSALLLFGAETKVRNANTADAPSVSVAPQDPASWPFVSEHRYRIAGRIRLLLFWVASDDVGSARLTRRLDGVDGREFALLIGSDPQRAPRGINEWGYIHERVTRDEASVFGVRTVTEADSPDGAKAKMDTRGRTLFGAICSRVTAHEASAAVATVGVSHDVSYREFDRLLDAVVSSGAWNSRHVTRPEGAAPGFLTALNRLMEKTVETTRARRAGLPNSVAYVYKDSVYDLSVRRAESIAEFRTEAGTFHNLLRTEFAIRNRRTSDVTRFSVTYGTNGTLAGVPVEATYQPNWWLKIRLELDERSEVAADPSGDELLRQRIDDVCATALRIKN